MKVAWTVPAVAGNSKGIALAGSWLTSNSIVDGRPDGIIAYAIGTGQQTWSLQAPNGLRACAMSAVASNNIGVIGYGPDQYTCDRVAAVDLSSGRQLWQVDLADHSKVPARLTNPQISISRDIVAVRTTTVIQGYGLSDGKLRWATPKEPPFSATSCSLGNEAAGPKLVYAVYTCFSTAKQSLKLVGYDRTSGAQTWTGEVSQLPVNDQPAIVSADPLIVTDTNAKQAYSFASGGTSPVKIDLHGLSYQVFETQNDGQALLRHAYAIVGNTLYAQGADQQPLWNTVVAIDLASGRQLWSKDLGHSVYATVIGADAAGIHAITEVTGRQVYQLVTYAPADGRVSYGASSSDSRFTFTPQDMLYLSNDGHLIDLPAATAMAQREIIVLAGAR
jgi:outer membrane protein assembly factor BamB